MHPKKYSLLLFFVIGNICIMPFLDAAEMRGYGRIKFFGTSTLHDFDGTVQSNEFSKNLDPDDYSVNDFRGLSIDVPVREMDTGNRRMNKNMYKMFDANQYPLITGTISAIEEAENSQGLARGAKIEWLLKIRNIERPVTAVISGVRQTDDKIELDFEMEISCRNFKLEPPTFLGVLRVGDIVRIEATMILRK